MSQDGAKMAQDDPKVIPKMTPRDPQRTPGRIQERPMRPPKASKMDQDGAKESPKAPDERKRWKMQIIEKPLVFIAFLRSWGSQLGSCWAQDGSVEVQVASC